MGRDNDFPILQKGNNINKCVHVVEYKIRQDKDKNFKIVLYLQHRVNLTQKKRTAKKKLVV